MLIKNSALSSYCHSYSISNLLFRTENPKSKEKMSYHYPRHNLMKDQNLLIAAKCGDVNLVRDLINAGYPISHKDKYGKTALHHAVEGNCLPDLFCECRFFLI